MHVITVLLSVLSLAAVPVHACSSDYPIWQNRDKNADPYYRFVRGGTMGYIDKTGKIVVQPTHRFSGGNNGDEFHDGLLLTGVSAGPYIDATGKVVLNTGFDRNWDFSDGLAAAMRKTSESRWGYIDRTGQFVIEPKFESYPNGYVYPFSNRLAMIEVKDQFGFIDTKGDFVISPSYLWAQGFSEDRTRVIVDGPCVRPGFEYPCDFGETLGKTTPEQKVPGCKFRFIDKSGTFIGTNGYDDTRDFSEGLAAVQKDGKWGFIDKAGKLVVPFKFGSVGSFSDGLARVAEGGMWEDKRWGYIDATGRIVIPFQFERAEDFSDGLAPVADKAYAESEKERFYYINKSGNQAFTGMFAQASPFFKGIGHVKLLSKLPKDDFYLNGKFAYIDTKGRTVFSYEHNAREY
jgi:WG containing repeat